MLKNNILVGLAFTTLSSEIQITPLSGTENLSPASLKADDNCNWNGSYECNMSLHSASLLLLNHLKLPLRRKNY